MQENKYLLKVFSTPQQHYVYDALTGRIFQCDELTSRIFKGYEDNKTEQEILDKIGASDHSDAINRIKEIDQLREEKGFFIKGKFGYDNVGRLGPLKNYIQIVFNVTENCNLQCNYCIFGDAYPEYKSINPKVMSIETALLAAKLVTKYRYTPDAKIGFTFFGGEPLLEFNLIRKMINEMRQTQSNINFIISMTTNGTIMKPEILKYFVNESVELWISLDGPKPVHDMHRNCGGTHNGSFDTVMKTLRSIKDYDRKYYEESVGLCVTLAAPLQLKIRADFFANEPLLPRKLKLRISDQISRGLSTEDLTKLSLANQELYKELESYTKIIACPNYTKEVRASRKHVFWDQLFGASLARLFNRRVVEQGIPRPILSRSECLPDWPRLFVEADGDLYPCIPSTYDIVDRFKIGNVRDGIDEKKVNKIMEEWNYVLESRCAKCWCAGLCEVCFAMFPFEQADNFCKSARKHLVKLLRCVTEIKEMRPDVVDLYDNPFYQLTDDHSETDK